MKSLENIEITYKELAFVTGADPAFCKEVFQKIKDTDSVSTKCTLPVSDLLNDFEVMKSCFVNIDGKNSLLVKLSDLKYRYKKYLSARNNIKQIRFTGAQAIFYKVLSPEEINHAKKSLAANHRAVFGVTDVYDMAQGKTVSA